jgi:hypothetical protein
MIRAAFATGLLLAAALASPALAQGRGGRGPQAVGTKIADGQAYATLVELKHQANAADNGKLLLAFEANGFDGIPVWESTDHGTSWHFVANAHDPQETDKPRCDLHWQPHLTEMPRAGHGIAAGTVLLSASTVCQQPAPGRGTQLMHLRLFASADLGRSWAWRSTYAEGTGEAPVWEPHLLILDDGRFVEFYSDETHKADGYNQMLGHKVSTDGGLTWGPEVYDTAMKGGVERPGMVIVARLPDGRYAYNFEDVAGPFNQSQVYLKFSRDQHAERVLVSHRRPEGRAGRDLARHPGRRQRHGRQHAFLEQQFRRGAVVAGADTGAQDRQQPRRLDPGHAAAARWAAIAHHLFRLDRSGGGEQCRRQRHPVQRRESGFQPL